LHSFEFEGAEGFAKMQKIMENFRDGKKTIGGKRVLSCLDYSLGLAGLPKSNVLKFLLENNCSVVIRPSGTEPKLKIYISISAGNSKEAEYLENIIAKEINTLFV
jgi:phosphoglucomutase